MLNIGDIVISKQGHDKKEIFVVLEIINDRFVLISDGKNKGINSPKLKNQKHLKFLTSSEELAQKIKVGTILDKEIVKQIKNFDL